MGIGARGSRVLLCYSSSLLLIIILFPLSSFLGLNTFENSFLVLAVQLSLYLESKVPSNSTEELWSGDESVDLAFAHRNAPYTLLGRRLRTRHHYERTNNDER